MIQRTLLRRSQFGASRFRVTTVVPRFQIPAPAALALQSQKLGASRWYSAEAKKDTETQSEADLAADKGNSELKKNMEESAEAIAKKDKEIVELKVFKTPSHHITFHHVMALSTTMPGIQVLIRGFIG
jgi:hypothetical protein